MNTFKSSCKLRVDSDRLYWDEKNWVSREFAIDLIVSHYEIRAAVQRLEYLKQKCCLEIQNYNEELEKARQSIGIQERNLYWCETRMTSTPLSAQYALLRQKPGWYLRSELIEDCKGSGGCCSRRCGCCSKRQSSKLRKAAGHCTAECSCCSTHRKVAFTKDQKEAILKQFRQILERPDNNSAYLCRMTIGYFSEIDIPQLKPALSRTTKEEQSDDETLCDNKPLCEGSEKRGHRKEKTISTTESKAPRAGLKKLLGRKG
ncbi:hypothetical protein N7454_006307 [Penicillium verhagenii]|nr:hypothetical protein N7454_006307 [Penicillium verhagenii]